MKIHSWAAVAVIVGLQISSPLLRAAEISDEKLDALIKRIDELEKQVNVLKGNNHPATSTNVSPEGVGGPAPEKTKVGATVELGSGGLVVRSADSNFVFNMHGYAQADERLYFGQKTANDTFLLRRVRPIFEGTVYNMFDYRLMLDVASTITSPGTNNNSFIDDAYVNARLWPQFQVQAGKYKAPVGLERLQSTANLPFVETGLPTQFTPNYDLGFSIHNELFNTPVNYSVGIYNGTADGGSDDIESTDEGKEFVGRLFAQPFLDTDIQPLRGLGVGVAGSGGFRTGTMRSYTTQGQQTFFSYGNAASTVSANGLQYRIDPQAFYYWGPFGILGEYVISSQELRRIAGAANTTQRFNNTAWQVIGSYFITGEQNSYKQITPLHPVGLNGGGWGAWELVARFGQMKMDNALFPLYASTTSAHEQTSWGAGVNWHLNRNVKLQLDYESTTFRNGSSATGSATAHPEHVILSRVQFGF